MNVTHRIKIILAGVMTNGGTISEAQHAEIIALLDRSEVVHQGGSYVADLNPAPQPWTRKVEAE